MALRAALLLSIAHAAAADPVVGLTTFTAGTPARAAEVNANFTAVKTAVDNNHQRIVTLETELAALRAQIGNPQVQALLSIAPYVTLATVNDHPVVRFTSVNVQIMNGTDDTYLRNGTGNLIIGYDEPRFSAIPLECSIGFVLDTTTPVRTQAQCTAANGTWALDHKTGSHNLVVGDSHNYAGTGALVAGYRNSVTNEGASVTGGMENHAVGFAASVTGGLANWAFENASTISGGADNQALGPVSSISGGSLNRTGGYYSSISGGENGIASGAVSSVSGGINNFALGQWSSAQGGSSNRAVAVGSSISGGSGNNASGRNSSVLGGATQIATAENITIPALP